MARINPQLNIDPVSPIFTGSLSANGITSTGSFLSNGSKWVQDSSGFTIQNLSNINLFRATTATAFTDSATAYFFQIGNSSGNHGVIQSYAGNTLGRLLLNSPNIVIDSAGYGSVPVPTGALEVRVNTASQVGQVIRGATSQTGDLQRWQTWDGTTATTATYVRNDGLIHSTAGYTGQWAWINGYRANTTLAATANNDSAPTVIFRALAGQTQDLLRLESSTPATIFKVGPTGDATFGYGYVSGLRDSSGTGAYLDMQSGTSGILINTRSSSNNGLIVRAASGQTENIQVWQSSAPATLARISQTGSIATAANLSVGATGIVNGNQFQVTATSATQVGAVIKAAVSQSANLTEWQDSNGNILAKVAESGQIATSGRLTVGSTAVSTLGQLTIPLGLDRVGLVVKATSGQTLNLQEWQDNGGNVKSYITADGSILTSSTLTGTGNLRVGGLSSTGGGLGVIGISNATTVPASSPTGGGILYVDTGALKYRGTSGSAQNLVSADGTINFNGDVNASGYLKSNNSSGDEGGEIFLSKSVTNTTITNGVTIDVYQNKLRFFEQGGTARGYYIDITTGGAGVATNLVGSGSYTLPTASTTVLGGVKLNSDTVQTTAANAVSSTASRTYGIQLDGSGQMVTNVPWTDTVYTLPTASATVLGGIKVGTNLSIDGSGVLSSTDTNTTYIFASGTTNGAFSYTPSGGSATSVSIYGLGTAAYKNIPATGNASATEVVYGTDTRLSDSRTPTSHTHGNISNTGTLSTSVTATNPVKVVITDSGNTVGTLATTNAGSTTFLRGDGTWANLLTINTTAKTGAYTLQTSDYGTMVQMNGAFAFTVGTGLYNAPVGTQITLLALTSGVTVAASGTGVTVNSTPGLKLRAAYSTATLICLASSSTTCTWLLTGDLSA